MLIFILLDHQCKYLPRFIGLIIKLKLVRALYHLFVSGSGSSWGAVCASGLETVVKATLAGLSQKVLKNALVC